MQNDELKTRDLRLRTKRLALRVIRLYSALPEHGVALVVGRQLLRCGTSVGAQYREAWRARSGAEFKSKMQSALQELDETTYWLEILVESGVLVAVKVTALMQECQELIAIFVASIKT